MTKIRVWPSLDQDLHDQLVEIAAKEHRKVHEMAAILIENAIKERQRKRKNAKEDTI
jgi:hypothetical protein